MSEIKTIGQIMCEMAANPTEPMGKLLRKCPVAQAELLKQGRIYYRRQDIQQILADNYTMYRLHNGYGKNR